MSSSATGSSTSAPVRPTSSSVTGYVMTARVVLALIAVQFGLAGLGSFQGLDGKDAESTWWEPHSMLGYGIGLLTLALVALAIVGKLGRPTVRWTAIGAGLTVIGQPLLAMLGDEASAWFGALHAVNAVAVAAALGILSARVARPATTSGP
jgi:hypothetical protein